jgi:hypothetical protein
MSCRELFPALEALLRPFALLRRHREPALGAALEGLLTPWRQGIPLIALAREQLLFGR